MKTINKESFFAHGIDEKLRQVGPRRVMYFCYDAKTSLFSCLYHDQKPIYTHEISADFAEEVKKYLEGKEGIKVRTLAGVEGSFEASYFNPAYYRS